MTRLLIRAALASVLVPYTLGCFAAFLLLAGFGLWMIQLPLDHPVWVAWFFFWGTLAVAGWVWRRRAGRNA